MDLPEHIQLSIAFHLPLVDCKALSCACKSWNLTARQSFWRCKTYQLRKKEDNGEPRQSNVDWKVTYEVYQRFLDQCGQLVNTFSQLAEQNNQLRTRLDELEVNMRELQQRRQSLYAATDHEADSSLDDSDDDSSSLDGSEYDSSDSGDIG